MNFGTVISQEHNQQSCWNFYSIFVIIRNRPVKLFSVITQPWRHPGTILCFDVIIDIFISVYHKLTKFNTHKLQVIWQHTDNPCPRARHDAHVRARQNFNMLKITYKQFWARTRSFRAFLAHLSRRLEWAIAVRFRPSSVVRRPSCVVRRASCVVRRPSSVNFLHFHLLLENAWLDFNQTWQESSLGVGDSKLFKSYVWPPWGPRGRAPKGQNHANFKHLLLQIQKENGQVM